MLKSRRVWLFLIIFLILTCILTAPVTAAKEIRVSSVTGVPLNATGIINVSIVDPISVDAISLTFTYSSNVMNITGHTNDVPGWNFFVTPTQGSYIIAGWPNPGSEIIANRILFDLSCEAFRNDGKPSFVNVTITSIEENSVEKKTEYATINGTFTPIDTQPPVITITYPTSSTVPQDVNVTATITDWGGVSPGSWAVTVNDINAPIINVASITNGYQIKASRTGVPLGSAFINVSAQDLSLNIGRASKPVTVASSGFTFSPDLNGQFPNQSQPVVNAVFTQVNNTTVRMFIGSSPSTYVNVTDKCDIPGSATDGSINLSYIRYGAMADGIYWVKVNGTSSLTALEVSATEAFTKDTTPPVIAVTTIADSDGDSYAEAGELLTISYTLTDSNPANVWIGTEVNNTGNTNGKLFYTPAKGNLIGNINTTIHARDLANLESQSAAFHIYNNYLAYITDPSLGTMVGLNLSRTSVYDIFNATAKAISISGANDAMRNPQLGEFTKTVTGGSKVVVDNRADMAIAAGALPQDLKIYATPVGTFDYTITVPNVSNATMILVRANSTMLNESINTRSFSQSNLKNLVDMNLIAIYSNGGVQVAGIDAGGDFITGWGNGTVTLTNNNLPRTIRDNYINPSAGYSTAARGLSFDVGLNLTKGEYILAAVCMDNDRLGIIAQTPFIVTEQPKTILSANLTAYPSGVPVKVTSTIIGDYIGAVVLRNDVVYTGNMTVDFSSLGPGSLKEMNLFGDGNRTVMENLISKINITKGYGKFAKVQNANTVEVPTDELLQGNYYVYMFLENRGNLTAFNQVNVTIGALPPQPATVKVNVFNATSEAFNANTITIWNGTYGPVVVNEANTTTFTGLANGTIYQLSVNRTGFLNVSSSITAVNGQRNVTVNLTQLGQLYTPKVVLSENGTTIGGVERFYQPPTGEWVNTPANKHSELLIYNLTIAGNESVGVALEFMVRLTVHPLNVKLNSADIPYQYVNGTFTVDDNKFYTTTNATVQVHAPAGSNGKIISLIFSGTLKGDNNNDGVVDISDRAFGNQVFLRQRIMPPAYDYGDVVGIDHVFDLSDVAYITQNFLGQRDY